MKSIPILFCAALAATTCANADTDATMARNRAVYERHAGAPVDEVRMWKLYDWLPLGEDAFAVWTAVLLRIQLSIFSHLRSP